MRNILRRQSSYLSISSPDPQPNSIPSHRQVAQRPVRDGPHSDMPRRPRGWTRTQFYDQRDMQRRRTLAMNPSPLSNSTIAEPAQSPETSTGGLPMPNTRHRPREQSQAPAQNGISFVRDRNGSFQTIPSLMAPRAKAPGIMEPCLRRLGLEAQTIDNGTRTVRRRTSMGVLELVGTVELEFRHNYENSSCTITVEVWRGDERGRVGLYFDPLNSYRFFTPSDRRVDQPNNGVTDVASVISGSLGDHPTLTSYDADASQINTLLEGPGPIFPGSINLNVIPPGLMYDQPPAASGHDHMFAMGSNLWDTLGVNQVFPLNTYGPMSMAVGLDGSSLTEFTTEPNNTLDNHLPTPQDLIPGNYDPHLHRDHHFRAPDGFCPQCWDDAGAATAV